MIDEGLYRAIYADPPWAYQNWTDARNGAASSAMVCMEADAIAAIPVADWAHPEGAHLFMWGTLPKLPEAVMVLAAWGFEYKTAVPWTKTVPSTGNIRTGIGFWTRGASELLLIGACGGAKRQDTQAGPPGLLCGSERQFWAPRHRQHSRKPLEITAWIERVCRGPYLELFARRLQPDWTCYGYDTGWELGPWGARQTADDIDQRQEAPSQDEREQRLLFAGRSDP